MAHASSSCQTDSQHYGAGGEEPGEYYHSKQQQGRSRRSRQQQRARSAGAAGGGGGGLYSVHEDEEGLDEDGEEGQVEQRQQNRQRQRQGDDGDKLVEEGSGDHDAAAEDAADGLASMRGSQGWGTPKRPSGGAIDFGIFRTGTPGGVGRASEFLLASPGVSDKQPLPPMPLPSPSGRRGRPLYGAAAASAAAAAAAGGPKSPAGRAKRGRGGRGRGRRGGSSRGGSGSGSRAGLGRDSAGSSGQRGGSVGAGDGGMNSEGALGGSEGEGGSDEEPELMDASELAGEASFRALFCYVLYGLLVAPVCGSRLHRMLPQDRGHCVLHSSIWPTRCSRLWFKVACEHDFHTCTLHICYRHHDLHMFSA
jgi:hypothetical protein